MSSMEVTKTNAYPGPFSSAAQQSVQEVSPLLPPPRQQTPWQSHEKSGLELPFTFWMPPCFYQVRNTLLWPLKKSVARIWGVEIVPLGVLLLLGLAALFIALVVTKRADYKTTGAVATIPLMLVYATASQNNIFTFILGIPKERMLVFHKWLGLLALGIGAFHGAYTYFNLNQSKSAVSGLILIILIAVQLLNSFFPIRKYIYQIFFYSHIIVAIAAIVLALIHGAGLAMIGMGLWLADLGLRALLFIYYSTKYKTALATRVSPDIVRLEFFGVPSNMNYLGGQYCNLIIPAASPIEVHPISIASAPHQQNLCFFVRNEGDWTNRLYQAVPNPTQLKVLINGAYGSPSADIESATFKSFLFVSGGIGVTPMKSIAQSLISQRFRGREINAFYFIWVVREMETVSAVMSQADDNLVNPGYYQMYNGICPFVVYRVFLTREKLGEPLPFYVTKGRPKLPEIFDEVANSAAGFRDDKVAVLACGPETMVKEVSCLCKTKSWKTKVRFDLHTEVFEY